MPCHAYCAARVTTFDHAPVLGLRHRTHLGDADHVAFLALAVLVVRVHLGRTAHDLAVQRMLHLALEQHGDRLLHLVADHATFDRALRFSVVSLIVMPSLLLRAEQRLDLRDLAAHALELVRLRLAGPRPSACAG